MTTVTTDTRTPLWAMTDEQLLFVASDDTEQWDRRFVAVQVLRERHPAEPTPEPRPSGHDYATGSWAPIS